MKDKYPRYEYGATEELEKNLQGTDKQIYKSFMEEVSATAGKFKQNDRRKDILQIRDVIEKDFDTWTYEDIVKLIGLLKESDRAVWTQKGILTTLTIFIKWKWEDWSKSFKNLDIIKKRQKQLEPNNSEKYNKTTMPTPEEIDKMIRSADKLWHKLWLSMVAESGIPFAVQSSLRWSNLEIDLPEDGITTLKYFRNKNKTEFVFPLGKTTTYYLKQWEQEYPFTKIKKSDLVFPSPYNRDKPITQPTIHTMLNAVSKKSGVNKHMYQYLIRHQVLSNSYGKMSEEIHRKIYGHKSGSKMTKTYSHQDTDDTLKKALELLHKVKPLTKEEESKVKKMEKEVERLNKLVEDLKEFVGLKPVIDSVGEIRNSARKK